MMDEKEKLDVILERAKSQIREDIFTEDIPPIESWTDLEDFNQELAYEYFKGVMAIPYEGIAELMGRVDYLKDWLDEWLPTCERVKCEFCGEFIKIGEQVELTLEGNIDHNQPYNVCSREMIQIKHKTCDD